MKTTTDLFERVNAGVKPVVKFGPVIEDSETAIDRNMFGRIISVERHHDDVFAMYVDLNDFDAHNDSVAQRNYYDTEGNPTLTAKEAKQHPKDGIEKVYMDYDRTLEGLLTVEGEDIQVTTVKVKSATVYQTEGDHDTIIVELPVPMPLANFPGNVKMTLIADEGTGVAYMKEHFGIDCEIGEGDADEAFAQAAAAYGIAV